MDAFWWRHGMLKVVGLDLVDCWTAPPSGPHPRLDRTPVPRVKRDVLT